MEDGSKAQAVPEHLSFGDPRDPAVVFSSGIYLGPRIYSRFLSSISNHGFHVIGLPSVTKATKRFGSPTEVAKDFWARIETLKSNEILRSPIAAISGHSAGGWIAIAAAHERPDSVPGMVLVNTSAGEDYNLAMKRRVKAATDITRQVIVSLTFDPKAIPVNWFVKSPAHQKLVKLMEKFTLDDELEALSQRDLRHSQIVYTDRDYLVTDVGISQQERALKKTRTMFPGHHGSCIPDGVAFGDHVGSALRANEELFEHLGVQPGSGPDRT